jgi:hypothetical protein
MLVESAKSAIKRIEKLMKKMNEGSIYLDEPIEIDEYLTCKIMMAKMIVNDTIFLVLLYCWH